MTIFRNRKYLDFLRTLPCMFHISGVCSGGQTIAAHSNALRHGRGVGHKASDSYSIASCNECHRWYDEGKAKRADKDQAYQAAVERQLAWLVENEKIRLDK